MTSNTHRLRVTFSKGGLMVYTSHLDLARAWERTFRRAGMPVAYSMGFNPRPRIQLAAALPLGHYGDEELLDVWLEEPVKLDEVARALPAVLPAGLAVKAVREIPSRDPALQTQVVASEYEVLIEPRISRSDVQRSIDRILAETELPRVRRGKSYDLRPLIDSLTIQQQCSESRERIVLTLILAARAGATGRPEPVIESLGLEDFHPEYRRLRLLLAEEVRRAH